MIDRYRYIDLPHKAFAVSVSLIGAAVRVIIQNKLIPICHLVVFHEAVSIFPNLLSCFFLSIHLHHKPVFLIDKGKIIVPGLSDLIDHAASGIYHMDHFIGNLFECLHQLSVFPSIAWFLYLIIRNTFLGADPVAEALAIFVNSAVLVFIRSKCHHFQRITA